MPTVSNGRSLQPVAGGNVCIQVANGHILHGDNNPTLKAFTFTDAGVEFLVNQEGIVSLSITLGTITGQTYTNGQNIGVVTTDTLRTNNISILIPNNWDNGGDTITHAFTTTQLAANLAEVTTLSIDNRRSHYVDLVGRVDDDGGIPITGSGFYWILGQGFTQGQIVSLGQEVIEHSDAINGVFSETLSGLTPGTQYSYVAYATNALGTSYGQVVDFTTDVAVAVAQWVSSGATACTGGTVSSSTTISVGDWYGAGDIAFDAGGNPTSASCKSTDEMCTIMQDTTTDTVYTGGSQDVEYLCTITQTGTGTPTCSAGGGLPTGDVGDLETATGTCAYTDREITTETRQVTNADFNTPGQVFGSEQIVVTGCSVNQSGTNASVQTDVGVATVTNLPVTSNTGSNPRFVELIFSVTGLIPEGFDDEFGSFTFTGLTTQCEQPGIDISNPPSFNNGTASVTSLTDGTQTAFHNDVIVLQGTSTAYNVQAPTGEGGVVMTGSTGHGAGSFTLPGGRGRSHSFEITNDNGTAVYSFIVETTL